MGLTHLAVAVRSEPYPALCAGSVAQQSRVQSSIPSPPRHPSKPLSAVLIPGTDHYDFKCNGTVIEPFIASERATFGIDVQFEWEAFPRNEHERTGVSVPSFYFDRTPVTMSRYAQYLNATGYEPADDTNYLREWPNRTAHRYPKGNDSVPVTGVSLAEARAFCRWADGRLPTTLEWQYAAQAGDPSNVYPWGTSDDPSKRPTVVPGGNAPAPVDSETLVAGANPLGVLDLIGNVWQYTDRCPH